MRNHGARRPRRPLPARRPRPGSPGARRSSAARSACGPKLAPAHQPGAAVRRDAQHHHPRARRAPPATRCQAACTCVASSTRRRAPAAAPAALPPVETGEDPAPAGRSRCPSSSSGSRWAVAGQITARVGFVRYRRGVNKIAPVRAESATIDAWALRRCRGRRAARRCAPTPRPHLSAATAMSTHHQRLWPDRRRCATALRRARAAGPPRSSSAGCRARSPSPTPRCSPAPAARTRHLPLLFDAFWQVLPFGTGGRRGRVGYGANRINPTTVAMTIQGHCDFLQGALPRARPTCRWWWPTTCACSATSPAAYGFLGADHPLLGLSSRGLAKLACEIYAGNGIAAYLTDPPSDSATLSHARAVLPDRARCEAVGRREHVGLAQPARRQRGQDLRRVRQPAGGARGSAAARHHGRRSPRSQSLPFAEALAAGLVRAIPARAARASTSQRLRASSTASFFTPARRSARGLHAALRRGPEHRRATC